MKFTVTYRRQDGSPATEVIDAADRAAAVASCRARGIVPKSIMAGGRVASPSRRPAWIKGAVAGAAVIVVAFVAWFFLVPKPQTAPAPAPPPKKHVAPKPAATPKPRPKPAVTNAVAKPAEPKPVKVDPNARPEKVGEIVNGYIKLPSGRLHRIRGEVTNDVARASGSRYEIF